MPLHRNGQRFVPPLLPPHRCQHQQASAQHPAEYAPDEGTSPTGRVRETAQTFGLGFDRDWDPLAVLQVCNPEPTPTCTAVQNACADVFMRLPGIPVVGLTQPCVESMRPAHETWIHTSLDPHAMLNTLPAPCRTTWKKSVQLEAAGAHRRPSVCHHPAVMLQPLPCRAPATSTLRVIPPLESSGELGSLPLLLSIL